MAEELRKEFGVEANLIQGPNGIFEVMVDGKVIFSKDEMGRFPDQGEIISKLKQ